MEFRRVVLWHTRAVDRARHVLLSWFLRLLHLTDPPHIARGNFLTIHKRPVNPIGLALGPEQDTGDEGVGIVIQGPLVETQDFTLNSIRQYRQFFPRVKMVFSSTDEVPRNLKNQLRDLGCEVILIDTAGVNPGISNTNLQILTSSAGVQLLREQGCDFALKVRSDQRIYNRWILSYLKTLIQQFPVNPGLGQRARLVFMSLNSFLDRVYGLSDMLVFGDIDDVALYWSGPLDPRNPSEPLPEPPFDDESPNVAEAYLFAEFLKKVGDLPDWSNSHYERVLRSRVLVINSDSFDLYWPKYSPREHRWRRYESSAIHTELTFEIWLLLCAGRTTLSGAMGRLTTSSS